VGSATPVFSVPLPANATPVNINSEAALDFSLGRAYAITNLVADTDADAGCG
jgi:hypothetical protein